MKRVFQVILAIILVAALAGFSLLMWKVEKRDIETFTRGEAGAKQLEAFIAKSLLPMVDRLQLLQQSIPGLQPGSPAYTDTSEQITEIKNLIAAQIPTLVVGHDEQGNALIVPTEETRTLLNAIITRWGGG
jgi:hypothetical protein